MMRALILLGFAMVVACSQPPCRQDYGSCETSSDCGGNATCADLEWAFGAGSICTTSCENELDCPRSHGQAGRCLDVGSGTFSCYEVCAGDTDCPPTWVCQPIRTASGIGAVCMP